MAFYLNKIQLLYYYEVEEQKEYYYENYCIQNVATATFRFAQIF